MKKIEGIIFEGEFLGVEQKTIGLGQETKTVNELHMLKGYEALTLKVKNNTLIQQLNKFDKRQEIVVKADVTTFKDNLYLTAVNVQLCDEEVA